jgi:hypothetical protein
LRKQDDRHIERYSRFGNREGKYLYSLIEVEEAADGDEVPGGGWVWKNGGKIDRLQKKILLTRPPALG